MIRSKVLRGAAWNAAAQHGSQIVQAVSFVVLARLLDPGDFGLLTLAFLAVSFAALFCEYGLGATLVQKGQTSDRERSSAFWAQLVLAAASGLVLAVSAPFLAEFFRDPRLTALIRVSAAALLFTPLNSIAEALETQKIRYDRIAAAEVAGTIAASVAAMVLAWKGFGVWSLVVLEIAKRAVRGVLLTALSGWKPTGGFSAQAFGGLAGPAGHFTLKNFVYYLAENVDGFLIGRVLGAGPLGLYGMGYRIPSYPVMKVWGWFGPMLFPAFSLMQEERARLKANLVRVSWLGGYFLMPLVLLVLFGAEPIVRLVLGEKWIEIVPVVRLFCALMAVTALSLGDESALLALGRVPALNAAKLAFTAAVAVLGFAAAQRAGIVGVTAVYVACCSLYMIAVKAVAFRAVGLRWGAFASAMRPVAVTAAGSAAALALLTRAGSSLPPAVFTALGLAAAAVCTVLPAVRSGVLDWRGRKINLEKIASVGA